jgi:hypothetical protein
MSGVPLADERMAYFIILPAFVVWLIVAAIALAVIRTNTRFSSVRPYAWRVVLWSTGGFIAANGLLVVIVAGAASVLGLGSPQRTVARDALQLIVGFGAIVGPIPASLLGWLGGAVLGALLARRAGSRKN